MKLKQGKGSILPCFNPKDTTPKIKQSECAVKKTTCRESCCSLCYQHKKNYSRKNLKDYLLSFSSNKIVKIAISRAVNSSLKQPSYIDSPRQPIEDLKISISQY